MKSIKKFPCELVNNITEQFCNDLWELSPDPKCRELGAALDSFQESMRNWIISELYASSIVEEEEVKI